MKIAYLQKYTNATPHSSITNPSPILKALKNAINVIKSDKPERNVGMVLSPGYLSTTGNTSDKLVNELLSNNINILSHTWILNTMNGWNKVNGSFSLYPYFFINSINYDFWKEKYPLSWFNIYNLYMSLNGKLSSPRLKEQVGYAKDHRKMIFLIIWPEGDIPVLDTHDDIDDFLKQVEVVITSIGSSNFSASTYFMHNDHNEADVLWINDTKIKNKNTNLDSISKRILGDMLDTAVEADSDIPEAVLANVTSLKNKNEENFLNNLLKQTLDNVLL